MDAASPSTDPVELLTPVEPTVTAVVADDPAPAHVDAPAPAPAEVETHKPEKGEFIVLVEWPANGQGHALASTKGKAQYWMLPNDEKLRKRMEDRRKQFFYARIRSDGKSLKLGKYAPYQEGW